MQMLTLTDPQMRSSDLRAENRDHLRRVYPEAFTEDKIDYAVLRQLLDDFVDDREEKYGLNWHGKRRARQLALEPSTGTLRPAAGDGVAEDTTRNVVIEGDNLEVLKLLQKSYSGQVKLIYIDPPYNTGKDFVYPDNFRDSIKNYKELTGQVAGEAKITSNPETSGRFHTDWLNMMYPRLKLARNLLREDGIVVVSCDDNEMASLVAVMNELFGTENYVSTIVWQKKYSPSNDTINIATVHDYLVVYQKTVNYDLPLTDRAVLKKLARSNKQDDAYKNPDNDPRGPWKAGDYTCNKSAEERPNLYYPVKNPKGKDIWPSKTRVWGASPELHEQHVLEKRLWWGVNGEATRPSYKRFLYEVDGILPSSWWTWQEVGHTDEARKDILALFEAESPFHTPKPIRLIQRLCALGTSTNQNDLVMDFFAGSGTTGHAVMAQNAVDGGNRRYILVQLPEPLNPENKEQKAAANFCDSLGKPRNIAELTKERLRRAGKKVMADTPTFAGDVGFRVFRLDSSNLKVWDTHPENLEQSLYEAVDHVKPDRSAADLLAELMLKRGLDLCARIDERVIGGKTVSAVGGGELIACFAESITADDAEALAFGIEAWLQELAPAKETAVVFRDASFADDVAKSNLAALLE